MAVVSPYQPDSRGNRVQKHEFLLVMKAGTVTVRVLDMRGPGEAAWQIGEVAAGSGRARPVPDSRRGTWTHRFEFPAGVPTEVRHLVSLLEEVLTLTNTPHLNCVIALDWYKVPDDELPPDQWANTDVGALINRGKYSGAMDAAGAALADRIAGFMQRHPLYRDCSAIVTAPGSRANQESFGERLAATVAQRVGKTLVVTQAPKGARPPAKQGQAQLSPEECGFEMPQRLSGSVVVVDDVYRTGSTMRAVAYAARHAGARRVLGVVGARTLRR